jgi:dTDP-4-dehydrorhamnose 3,5-epimerase
MEICETIIPDVKILVPKCFGDDRGFFMETYNQQTMQLLGIDTMFVQDNHSYSRDKGTVRGLHFQVSPHIQAKLLRVVKGSILDVAADIRKGSPTQGCYVAVILSAENQKQLYIPDGFAHGYCTLEADTEVLYKASDFYSKEHEHGIRWDDPDFKIEWGVTEDSVILSDKDGKLPFYSELEPFFTYSSS